MVKLINLTSLPCFRTFFQLYHDQSSTLHHISFFFFSENVFCLLFLSFLSTKLFLHIYHVVTGGEIWDRPDNLAYHLVLYVDKVIFAYRNSRN